MDTKKNESVGPFKNGGRELRPKGTPEPVRVHDFIIRELGRVTPYGVYDIAQNEAWVSVGADHDTAAFAVESIRRWWWSMGYALCPQATRLLITADASGSEPRGEGRGSKLLIETQTLKTIWGYSKRHSMTPDRSRTPAADIGRDAIPKRVG